MIHAFTDGRDTLPHSGAGYLETVEGWCREAGAGAGRLRRRPLLRDGPRLALGPHAARVRPARRAATRRTARRAASEAVREAYERGETDEFIEPTLVGDEATIRPDATASCASTSAPTACARSCARWPSRASRRWTAAGARPSARLATMTEYEEGWPYPVAFPPARPATTLARVLAERGVASCTSPRPRSTRT